MNTEWSHKIKDMKSYRMNKNENKRFNTLERLEKKDNNVLLSKTNVNSTLSKINDNNNTRLEYAKFRIYQRTEV